METTLRSHRVHVPRRVQPVNRYPSQILLQLRGKRRPTQPKPMPHRPDEHSRQHPLQYHPAAAPEPLHLGRKRSPTPAKRLQCRVRAAGANYPVAVVDLSRQRISQHTNHHSASTRCILLHPGLAPVPPQFLRLIHHSGQHGRWAHPAAQVRGGLNHFSPSPRACQPSGLPALGRNLWFDAQFHTQTGPTAHARLFPPSPSSSKATSQRPLRYIRVTKPFPAAHSARFQQPAAIPDHPALPGHRLRHGPLCPPFGR
jgi:hypothetical protein